MFKNINYKKLLILNMFIVTLLFSPQTIYAHEHSANCYGGTLHTCDGNTETGGNCYSQVETSCQGTLTYTGNATIDMKCPKCSTSNGNATKFNVKCNSCTFSGISYQYPKTNCSSCGTTLKASDETITYGNPCPNKFMVYKKTCGKTSGKYYNSKGQYLSPSCNKVVVSITPKIQNQTTNNPDFTIIATYLDGHTSEIKPTIVDYSKNKIYNNSTITLTYKGIVTKVGNNGELTTSITLTTPITSTPTPTPTQNPTITNTPTPTTKPTTSLTPTPIQETDDETNVEEPTPIITDENIDIDGTNDDNSSIIIEGEVGEDSLIITPNPNGTTVGIGGGSSIGSSGKYYDSAENEGIEEERNYLNNNIEEKDSISFGAILLIILAIVFGLIFIIYIGIVIVKKIIDNNKPVQQINLNDYMRKY